MVANLAPTANPYFRAIGAQFVEKKIKRRATQEEKAVGMDDLPLTSLLK